MNDDAKRGDGPALSPADLARRLREAADRIASSWTAAATGAAARLPGLSSLPAFPAPPATMSARQIQAVLDDLAARRAQVQALRTQLEGFDEQLGSLEATLRPVLEWTRAWADVEGALSSFWQPPSRRPEGPDSSP